jgi:cell division protein FtsL
MATAYRWSGPGDEVLLAAGQSESKRPHLLARSARPRSRKPAIVEFYTVKRIDNSRLVRPVEPVKLRNLYKIVALGSIVAAFCMLYIYQHYRYIDLGFQLEDLKGKTQQAQVLNSKLKLEIATLRDPHRVDLIARQLGLTQPSPNQMREFGNPDAAEVAAVEYVRPNRAP